MDQCGGDGAVDTYDIASFNLFLSGRAKQSLVDHFIRLRPDRTDGLVQDRLLRAPSPGKSGKSPEGAGIFQIEGQFLIAELTVLLEQSTAQHRFWRQAFTTGFIYAMLSQIPGYRFKQIETLIEPLRHGF